MKIKRYLPIAVAAAGVGGAILRGLNLHTGYEAGTCLPLAGNAAQPALLALSLAVCLVFFALSRGFLPQRGVAFETAFGCDRTAYQVCAVLAGLAMGVAGAGGLYLLLTGGVPTDALGQPGSITSVLPLVPLWILALGTMASFIVLASAQAHRRITENRAIFSIIPMFWACFDLIITFKDNGASPFVSLYAFELFAAIALVFAFYTLAGFLYARSNPARFVLSASIAVFFSWTCVGGYLVCGLLGGGAVVLTAASVLRYVCFAAASVYLLANLFICTKSLSKTQ